jgi:hypothetical protein
MIKVIFKLTKQTGYDDSQEFVYADYEGATVGDIVAVNTRYGYANAKVVKTDCYDENFNNGRLAIVECVIDSQKDREAKEKAQKEKLEKIEAIKRKLLLKRINLVDLDENEVELILGMTNNELESFIKSIK